MLNVTIDGIQLQVKEGSTILEAARSAGIEIPTLCYLKDLMPDASCRICLVEIQGNPKLFAACSAPDKKLIWFSKGGHSHLRINNTEQYDAAVIRFVNHE